MNLGLLVREASAWWRATLESIPGETGCFLRRHLYGFESGAESRVLSGVRIYHPTRLVLGSRVGISSGCQINAGGGVKIGDDVLIGPDVKIWSQNHRIADLSKPIAKQGYDRHAVELSADCWIGAGAIILPGVVLAHGTVVGAGAVVTRSVTAANAIVVGNPARIIRSRNEESGASTE